LIDANSILILISSTLFLGYVSGLFYSRTKIPDIIWLLAFGILLGPVLNYFDSALFVTLSPMMSIVALCIILFDAGINVDVRAIMETMHKSLVLSFTTFAVTVVVVGYALYYLMPGDFTLLQAMLFGSMVGGTSTVTVLGSDGYDLYKDDYAPGGLFPRWGEGYLFHFRRLLPNRFRSRVSLGPGSQSAA